MYARAVRIASVLLAAAAAGVAGCPPKPQTDLQRELALLKETLSDQENELAARQATINELHRQIQTARGFTDDQLAHIFYPEKIVIDSLSGPDDYDGKPGDDGITVYIRPVDRFGDAVKVAGDIRIELYDLALPGEQKLIGSYEFPVDQTAKLWYGKFLTYHFTLKCPWQQGPPKNPDITIRAVFRDFLTKRVMSAQTVVKVNAPPPASR